MVTNRFNKMLTHGILIMAACTLVLGNPTAQNDDERMQADDYDYYTDDQSGSNQQNKPSQSSLLPKANHKKISNTGTVTGILGKDIVLQCKQSIVKDNVVLWYQGIALVSTGNNLLVPNFSIDPINFDLTIIKASPQNEGDYICEVLPQKSRTRTKVIIAEQSMETITPESSTSAQNNLQFLSTLLLLTVGVGLRL